MGWKSGPLARSNDIPVLNGFLNTIDWDQNQSDLSDLNLGMRRVTRSPWIADFRSWSWAEVAIPVADKKDRGFWERGWLLRLLLPRLSYSSIYGFYSRSLVNTTSVLFPTVTPNIALLSLLLLLLLLKLMLKLLSVLLLLLSLLRLQTLLHFTTGYVTPLLLLRELSWQLL